METAVVVALISGGMTLIGVIISSYAANKKSEQILEMNQAVTNEKITELTREVRAHNNFAQRMPVLEEKLNGITRRVDELERGSEKR